MRTGYEELRKEAPRSAWFLNCYARMAEAAGDRATATRLLREIGDDYYASAWFTRANFDRAVARTFGNADGVDLPEVPLSILPKKP